MSDDLNPTIGRLQKEPYEPPLLTCHQPLLEVTGKSATKDNADTKNDNRDTKLNHENKVAADTLATQNPIKEKVGADTDKNKHNQDVAQELMKNGSPEKGNKNENEKSAPQESLNGKTGQ